MKILHIAKHLNIGGITSYLLTLCKGLQGKGYDIFILSSGGELQAEFEKIGVHCIAQDFMTKSELSPKLWTKIGYVKRLVQKEKMDIIHTHTRVTQVLGEIVSRLTKVKHVCTCHGFFVNRLGRRLFQAWGKKVIAVSPIIETHLVRDLKVDPKKIVIIPNGIDIESFQARFKKQNPKEMRQKLGILETEVVVGIVSRVVKVKGHVVLLEAIKKIRSEFPNLRVLIGGDGPFLPELKQLVHRAGLDPVFVFYGTTQDVTAPMSVIDIFVLPVLWEEGFGLAAPEAMACQKPIVVSDKGALNWLITAEKSGLVVKVGDSDALAQSLKRLILDPKLRQTLSQQAELEVREKFSMTLLAKRMDEFYRSVINL
jgi:glycosyltransferase involved in cell wall biosynthesis